MIPRIRQLMSGYAPADIDDPSLARAAVLLPLYELRGELHVLFTRRSELVEHHKGQISFPGGAHDDADADLRGTAIRETWEEIGVDASHIEVLGRLDEMITISNFLVRPFVGHITEPGPYPFSHSEIEVAEILEVPLAHLLNDANVTTEERTFQGRHGLAWSYHWRNHVIWGATARILHEFLELLKLPD